MVVTIVLQINPQPQLGSLWNFAYFLNLSIEVPPDCENYIKIVETYGNLISKCSGISENMAPILALMVLLIRSYSKTLL